LEVLRRQVHDIPPARPLIVEHRLHRLRRRRCGCGAVTDAPAGVAGPVQYGASLRALGGVLLAFQHVPVARTAQLIGGLIGASPSAGWVISVLGEATAALADVEKLIKSLIMLAHVVYVDETSVNINGARWWLHVAGNDKLTAYHLLSPADAPSWPSSRCCPTTHGIAVRDALSVDDTYPTPPTLCGAHVARELIRK
jgi:transposase